MFREYDIRGIVDQDFNEHAVEAIGKAYGTLLTKRLGEDVVSDVVAENPNELDQQSPETRTGVPRRLRVVVGHDARLSSPRFTQALVRGITSTGIDVVEIGIVPTPVLYFAVNYF